MSPVGAWLFAALLADSPVTGDWGQTPGLRQATQDIKPVPPIGVSRILVAPFGTPGRDGRTYWLGEAVSVLIADDISARGLGAITRQARERAYDQLHLPTNGVLS